MSVDLVNKAKEVNDIYERAITALEDEWNQRCIQNKIDRQTAPEGR